MKKFFIVTSVLFGIFLLFFLIYNFLFKHNPFEGRVPNMAVIPNETGSDKEEIGEAKAIANVTDEEAVAPIFDVEDQALLYLVPEEQVLKETFLVTNAPRTVARFSFVPRNIIWSPDRKRALVKKSDTEWALFTREKKGEANEGSPVQMLKPGIESPAWTTLGDKIVYKYYDPASETRTLNLANPDGTDWEMIGETTFQFLEIQAVPKSSLIAFWNWGNAFEETSLSVVGAMGGEAKEIFSKHYGVDYAIAPNGNTILLSNTIEKGGTAVTLATINVKGGNYRNLAVPTLAGKTVWAKNSRVIYYALPGAIPAGSILPNDYYRKPILTADTFWKMDTETNEKSRLVDPADIDRSYDAENLVLDTDETTLFFRNRHDGKIYKINL